MDPPSHRFSSSKVLLCWFYSLSDGIELLRARLFLQVPLSAEQQQKDDKCKQAMIDVVTCTSSVNVVDDFVDFRLGFLLNPSNESEWWRSPSSIYKLKFWMKSWKPNVKKGNQIFLLIAPVSKTRLTLLPLFRFFSENVDNTCLKYFIPLFKDLYLYYTCRDSWN